MRTLLIAALLGSIVFETHELAGQSSGESKSGTIQSQATPQQIAGLPKESKTPDAESKDPVADEKKGIAQNFNLPIKTTGGTQVWTDYAYRDGYRIQKHSLTGHHRLLDEGNIRRAWGTREQCQSALDELKPRKAPTKPQKIAILLHGLMRTNHSMKPLEKTLEQNGVDDTIRFSYASTRQSIGDSAAALREILEDQPAGTQFTFAGHSMGNIVVRHMIGDLQRAGDPEGVLPRCQAMVMMGPPNQGASIARNLAPTGLYGLVTGKGGMELGPEWDEFVEKLATPPFPFAIIAGDVSENTIQNPLVDGSGDFVVSLDEAKLDGSKEFHTVPVLHSFLMNDEKAVDIATDFIKKHLAK